MNLEQVAAASIKMPIFKVKTMQSKVSSKNSFFLFFTFLDFDDDGEEEKEEKIRSVEGGEGYFFLFSCDILLIEECLTGSIDSWKHLKTSSR